MVVPVTVSPVGAVGAVTSPPPVDQVSPAPSAKSGVCPSPALIGSCVAEAGQETGSLPVGATLPNSTSATPAPSLPGSHAASNALTQGRTPEMSSGRPETSTATVGTPAERMRWSAAVSVESSERPLGRSP